MALEAQLDASRHETAFLVPRPFHRLLRSKNRQVLDIDYQFDQAFRSEMKAYGYFRPDVVVDDLSLTALLTTKLFNKPRVTIRRTGLFPDVAPRNSAFRHSMHLYSQFDLDRIFQHTKTVFGLTPPKSLDELCVADMNIIPGIGSVEVLPAAIRDDPSYVFSGSLLISDSYILDESTTLRDRILAFLERNQHSKLAYVTWGITQRPIEVLGELITNMLNTGVAVISNVDLPEIHASKSEMFFHARFLPMDMVCSKAHLMVHHCGSGTYQYAIRHKVPSICIGSRCYDRDDVAKRLEELGVAKYIPADDDASAFVERFHRLFLEYTEKTSHWHEAAKQNLHMLKNENDQASAAFSFEAVLKKAIAKER